MLPGYTNRPVSAAANGGPFMQSAAPFMQPCGGSVVHTPPAELSHVQGVIRDSLRLLGETVAVLEGIRVIGVQLGQWTGELRDLFGSLLPVSLMVQGWQAVINRTLGWRTRQRVANMRMAWQDATGSISSGVRLALPAFASGAAPRRAARGGRVAMLRDTAALLAFFAVAVELYMHFLVYRRLLRRLKELTVSLCDLRKGRATTQPLSAVSTITSVTCGSPLASVEPSCDSYADETATRASLASLFPERSRASTPVVAFNASERDACLPGATSAGTASNCTNGAILQRLQLFPALPVTNSSSISTSTSRSVSYSDGAPYENAGLALHSTAVELCLAYGSHESGQGSRRTFVDLQELSPEHQNLVEEPAAMYKPPVVASRSPTAACASCRYEKDAVGLTATAARGTAMCSRYEPGMLLNDAPAAETRCSSVPRVSMSGASVGGFSGPLGPTPSVAGVEGASCWLNESCPSTDSPSEATSRHSCGSLPKFSAEQCVHAGEARVFNGGTQAPADGQLETPLVGEAESRLPRAATGPARGEASPAVVGDWCGGAGACGADAANVPYPFDSEQETGGPGGGSDSRCADNEDMWVFRRALAATGATKRHTKETQMHTQQLVRGRGALGSQPICSFGGSSGRANVF